MKYRKEIDGLRALAILPVLLFHANLQAFSGGFVGVDIFFVISGYLITRIILEEILTGGFSIANFYQRRIRRILPVLTLILLISTILSWFFLLPRDMKSFSESLISVIFFISNVYFKRSSGYFDEAVELKPLLHTWSLSVEEQFYLFFPLVTIFALRRNFKFLVKLILIFCFLSLALSQWAALLKPISAFYLLWARLWEFLIGSLIAIYLEKSESLPNSKAAAFGSWFGLMLIGYAVFAFDRQTVFPGLNALLPTLGAACIIIFASEKNHVGRFLSLSPLTTIGLISYSAYLWHQPLYAFVRHAVEYDLSPAFYLCLIVLTLALSHLTWRYVEQPFRRQRSISFRNVFLLWVFFDALLLSFGLVGKWTSGIMDRPNLIERYPQSVGHADFYEELSTYPICLPHEIAKKAVVYESIARCRQSKADTPPTLVLIGDSHAEHLFFGLSEQLKNENIAVFLNKTYPFYSEKDFSDIYNYLLDASSVHTVVIGLQWTRWFSGKQPGGSLHEELLRTIGPLRGSGKQVFLMGDIPIFPFSAERCKYKLLHTLDGTCTIPLEKVVMYQKEFMQELELVTQNMPEVALLSVRELFCSDAQCSMARGHGLMYRDESHLNVNGSRYVISELIKKYPFLAHK